MSGILYVVGTPIGNLGDITYRAVETLGKVDFVCAEDTRVSLKLLNHLGIKKPLVSYHEHSARQVSENIVNRIQAGESCAVVTDAGMPCISDPGADLIALCRERAVATVVIPGPTAVASAAAMSNIPCARFAFEGFLSVAKKQRYEHLEALAHDTHTLIFYEAPHKLRATLRDLYEHLGDRRISVCHELTKIHESVFTTTLSDARKYYEDVNLKGEFVLVVEGYHAPDNSDEREISLDEAAEQVKILIKGGKKPADACKEVASTTGYKKSELYSVIISSDGEATADSFTPM